MTGAPISCLLTHSRLRARWRPYSCAVGWRHLLPLERGGGGHTACPPKARGISKDFSVFARTMSRYVRFIDEPTLFGIDFDGVRDWASKHGWDVTDALCGPKEINTRFFADADKV